MGCKRSSNSIGNIFFYLPDPTNRLQITHVTHVKNAPFKESTNDGLRSKFKSFGPNLSHFYLNLGIFGQYFIF